MKKIFCDVCKKEMGEEEFNEFIELGFATIENKELRFFSDGDICDDCFKKMQKVVYGAIKTHVYNNIKIIGEWNK